MSSKPETIIRDRLDIASCRCMNLHGMLLSGGCPVHGENESNNLAYAALDALVRERNEARAENERWRRLHEETWHRLSPTVQRSYMHAYREAEAALAAAQEPPAEGGDRDE